MTSKALHPRCTVMEIFYSRLNWNKASNGLQLLNVDLNGVIS